MLCGWRATGEWYNDPPIDELIKANKTKFALSDQLVGILLNTAADFSWAPWQVRSDVGEIEVLDDK